jgi:hypothetical protein
MLHDFGESLGITLNCEKAVFHEFRALAVALAVDESS